MAKVNRDKIVQYLLLAESIFVLLIGCVAIKNARLCHQIYIQLKDAQDECHILRHALVENINLINHKDDFWASCRKIHFDKNTTSTDGTIHIMFSKKGCGGCAISLISQLIDDGRYEIDLILEISNAQIESTFSNDNKVTIRTVPQLFDEECPPCRIIYQKQGVPHILSYYSEMSEYLEFIL